MPMQRRSNARIGGPPPGGGKQGRPSKFTPDFQRRFLGYVRQGVGVTAAAAALGVSKSALCAWRHRFSDFSRKIEDAREAHLDRLEHHIARAAHVDWRAAAWILERRRPDEYSRRDSSGADGFTLEGLLKKIEHRRN